MREQTIRVLFLGRDPAEAGRLRDMLGGVPRPRFLLTAAGPGSAGDAPGAGADAGEGAGSPVDVVLLALDRGGPPPEEALRRARAAAPDAPVVMLCDAETEAAAEALLEPGDGGSRDLVSRAGLDGRMLARVLRYACERRRGEEALRRERDLLRTLIDHLPDHIYVKDARSGFVLNNAAHLRFLGAGSQEEILGKTDRDVFPDGVGEVFYAEEQEIIRTGRPLISREERNVDAGGTEHWVSSTKVPRRDAAGRVIGLVGLSRDVTDRVRAEQKLREQNARLEAVARSEREALETLKKAQCTLVQSEKLAGLGQMVAGVAHEINNPLAFVANNMAVLQRDFAAVLRVLKLYQSADPALAAAAPDLAAEIADLAEQIDLPYTTASLTDTLDRSREGLRRIQQIVKDLREFSRQEAVGEWQRDADLNAGIQSTVHIVRGRAKEQKVDVRLELEPLPPVTCCPAKINQVVMNLIVNAIDACGPGGAVSVRTRPAPAGGSAKPAGVEVEVADTGAGIDPAVRDRIFDPFFTTKPPGKGTGLGLSISYGIVRDHGGEIAVDSAPGRGSTFTIRLPLDGGGGEAA